jgi:hypothetical protein
VVVFNPPDVAVLEVVAVDAVEVELDPPDPQPAAYTSAQQAIVAAVRPLLIGTFLSRASMHLSLTNRTVGRIGDRRHPLCKDLPEECA